MCPIIMYVIFFDRSKKEVAREKRERRMTGGGPPPAAVDPMSQKVYDLIPAQFEPLDNPYDDDKPVISVAAGSAVEVVDVDDDASGTCTYKVMLFWIMAIKIRIAINWGRLGMNVAQDAWL